MISDYCTVLAVAVSILQQRVYMCHNEHQCLLKM